MSTRRTAALRPSSIVRALGLTLAVTAPLGLTACGGTAGSSADDTAAIKAVATAYTKAFVAEDTKTICSNGVGWKEAAAEEGAPDVSCDELIRLSLKQQDGDSLTSVFAVDPDELQTLRVKTTGDRALVATADGQESMPLVRSGGAWKVDVRRKVDPTDAERAAGDPKSLASAGSAAGVSGTTAPETSATAPATTTPPDAPTTSVPPPITDAPDAAAGSGDDQETAAVRVAVGRNLRAIRAADPARICASVTGFQKLPNPAGLSCRVGFGRPAASQSAAIPEVTQALLDGLAISISGRTATAADQTGGGKIRLRKVGGSWKVDVSKANQG